MAEGTGSQLINSSLEKWKRVSTMSARGATDGTESTNTKWTEISCGADIEKHTSLFFLAKVTELTPPYPLPQRAGNAGGFAGNTWTGKVKCDKMNPVCLYPESEEK